MKWLQHTCSKWTCAHKITQRYHAKTAHNSEQFFVREFGAISWVSLFWKWYTVRNSQFSWKKPRLWVSLWLWYYFLGSGFSFGPLRSQKLFCCYCSGLCICQVISATMTQLSFWLSFSDRSLNWYLCLVPRNLLFHCSRSFLRWIRRFFIFQGSLKVFPIRLKFFWLFYYSKL